MEWQTFGFDKIKNFFERTAKNGLLNHAYIFSGQEMIGKRTFALELVRLINRGSLGNTTDPDLFFVDSSSSASGQTIAIDEIRRVKNFISLSPYFGPYKFVVINDAHLMTTEAQNALLKILEEPSPSSILILVTANPNSLLPTIISRSQEIKFLPHSRKIVDEVLKKLDLPKSEAEFLAEFSNGRIGLVKGVIEERSFGEIKSAVEELARLVRVDVNERLTIAQKLSDEKNKPDLARKVLYWLLYTRMRINEPKARGILRGLTDLHKIISQPQFNCRLALENFVIYLPEPNT